MVNRPPSPQLVAARLREIKQRYEHHAKVSKRSRPMAAIRLAELTRWLDDTHGKGVELDPDDRSAFIARIFVHHFVVLADGNRRAADWMATYCPWIERRSRETMISEANHCPIKWTADKLGWHIRLTEDQRARLKITTIGALGINKEMRAARRNAAKAERERQRRAAARANRVSTI